MQKLTLVRYDKQDDYIVTEFACNFKVTTAGDGLWGCEAGREINVSNICIVNNIFDSEIYTQVNVTHDTTWEIYTDSAFEEAISEALGFTVRFTEQGMQEDNIASME